MVLRSVAVTICSLSLRFSRSLFTCFPTILVVRNPFFSQTSHPITCTPPSRLSPLWQSLCQFSCSILRSLRLPHDWLAACTQLRSLLCGLPFTLLSDSCLVSCCNWAHPSCSTSASRLGLARALTSTSGRASNRLSSKTRPCVSLDGVSMKTPPRREIIISTSSYS